MNMTHNSSHCQLQQQQLHDRCTSAQTQHVRGVTTYLARSVMTAVALIKYPDQQTVKHAHHDYDPVMMMLRVTMSMITPAIIMGTMIIIMKNTTS
jgi:hypothetical protein